MNAVLAAVIPLMSREIRERRLVLVAAAALGLLPVALSFTVAQGDRPDLRATLALTVCAILSVSLGILGGAAAVGQDLLQRRMGFYFSRPLSGLAIWGGKLAAVLALAVLCVPLTVLPTLLFDAGEPHSLGNRLGGPLVVLCALLVTAAILPLAHAAGVGMFSRSGWMMVDLVAFVTLTFAWWRMGRRLLYSSSLLEEPWAIGGAILAVLAVATLAGALGVLRGRTDIRRAHRVQSRALWSGLAALTLLLAGLMAWMFAATPADLRAPGEVQAAPRGSWVAIAGSARGVAHHWLLDVERGRSLSLGDGAVFSADGQVAAWLKWEGRPGYSDSTVVWLRLAEGSAPVESRVGFPTGSFPRIHLSPDGSRLAAFTSADVQVAELSTGRMLFAGRLPDPPAGTTSNWWRTGRTLRFASNDSLFFVRKLMGAAAPAPQGEIFALDVPAQELTRRATIARPFAMSWFSADGERLLVRQQASTLGLALLDARSGQELWQIERPVPGQLTAAFLADGRIALGDTQGQSTTLALLDPDGRPLARFSLPVAARRVSVVGEHAPGRVLLALGDSPRTAEGAGDAETLLVDVATGGILRREAGVWPIAAGLPWRSGGQGPAPGTLAAGLCYGPGGSLVAVDFTTGARRILLPGRT